MWSWELERRLPHGEEQARTGRVTLGGGTAVELGGERRGSVLCAPGGYDWRPGQDETVLVVQNRAGEPPCVVGTVEQRQELAPGQVRIRGGSCVILLGECLELTGQVKINGEGLEDYIRRVAGQEV